MLCWDQAETGEGGLCFYGTCYETVCNLQKMDLSLKETNKQTKMGVN